MRRFAATEAIAHLRAALDLLPLLPAERDREQMEYDLQSTLGTAIISARGMRASEAHAAYQRAYQLGKAIGDVDRLFPTLVGLETMACVKADYVQSQHLRGELLNYAQINQNPLHLAYAYAALSHNYAIQGRYLIAHHYAAACQRLPLPPYRLRRHPLYTIDPVLLCQRWDAVILVELGYPEQALALSRAVLAQARELGDSFSVGQGLLTVAQVSRYCLPPTATYEAAQALITYRQQQGQWRPEQVASLFLILAQAQLGDVTDCLARLDAILVNTREHRTGQVYSLILCGAADACYYAGHLEAGLAFLQEAEAWIDDTGERISEPELHGCRGKLLQGLGHVAQAEVSFVRALTLSRQLGAKGTELRVATLLSRLWQEQGEREKARHLLLPIYQGYTEGLDTAELQAAKRLLQQLES